MKTRWYLLLLWFLMDSAFAEVAEPAQAGWIAVIFFLVSAGIAILIFKLLNRLAKRVKGNAGGNDSASHDLDMNTTSDSTSHDNSFSGGGGDCGGGGASGD